MSLREELALLNDRFGQAFADQDLDRVAAFYANDARLLLPGNYVVVYERQPDGTLKLAVDAASSDGPASGG